MSRHVFEARSDDELRERRVTLIASAAIRRRSLTTPRAAISRPLNRSSSSSTSQHVFGAAARHAELGVFEKLPRDLFAIERAFARAAVHAIVMRNRAAVRKRDLDTARKIFGEMPISDRVRARLSAQARESRDR